MSNFHLYHDKAQQADLPTLAFNDKLNDPNLYVPSKGLMSAVNVALQLGQPLLLTGEPGTGTGCFLSCIWWPGDTLEAPCAKAEEGNASITTAVSRTNFFMLEFIY